MDALLAELTRPPSRAGRRLAIVTGALVLVAGAVVGGYALRSSDPPPKRAPIVAFDPKSLTNERGVAWLLATIERGQLDDASEKYTMAAALSQEAAAPAQTAIAWASGSLVLALRGRLEEARTKLGDAVAAQGADPTAKAYVDLATTALDLASGKLDAALEHGAACTTGFTPAVPPLAALCAELRGDAAAAKGDVAGARTIYSEALAKAKKGGDRTLTLELALAALDLDEVKPEATVATATALQTTANELGASAPEARAWILLARAHLAEAGSQQALDDLGHVKAATIEPFQIRIEHQIATGQSYALLGDPGEGLTRIDAARKEAETAGFPGLALAARLARMEVMITLAQPEVAAQRAALIKDARAQGYIRIVKLAMTIEQR
jgi:predicted negative regulator of RcsB-dependent stress response